MGRKLSERAYLQDIKAKCTRLGIWKDEYERAQRRLAKIYVRIDVIESEYEESDTGAVVIHTNKAGKDNAAKNPYLAVLENLYTQALSHERELGLTAAALRKLTDANLKAEEESPLDKALKALTAS